MQNGPAGHWRVRRDAVEALRASVCDAVSSTVSTAGALLLGASSRVAALVRRRIVVV